MTVRPRCTEGVISDGVVNVWRSDVNAAASLRGTVHTAGALAVIGHARHAAAAAGGITRVFSPIRGPGDI